MTKVGVVGATGYAGAELVRILSGHPQVTLSILTSRQYHGVYFSDVYPAMAGVVDLKCQPYDIEQLSAQADIIFTALPHKLPMELIPDLLRRGKKVIDLSADFRFRNADFYEAHYQPHTAKDLLAEAVYGLCEIYRDQIPAARLIGNPGCYPTSILLPLVPLAKAELIDLHTVVVDSKSGVSGAGRTPSLTTHYCEANESFKAYKVAVHRHNPEIDEILGYAAGQEVHITFVPHLVPMIRGMLSTIYVPLKTGVGLDDIDACLVSFYQDSPFVRLIAPERLPDTLHVKGTNFCDIGRRLDEKNNCLILISAIDNLVKGAAGQAVQNMNLMMGLDETEGLLPIPSAL